MHVLAHILSTSAQQLQLTDLLDLRVDNTRPSNGWPCHTRSLGQTFYEYTRMSKISHCSVPGQRLCKTYSVCLWPSLSTLKISSTFVNNFWV